MSGLQNFKCQPQSFLVLDLIGTWLRCWGLGGFGTKGLETGLDNNNNFLMVVFRVSLISLTSMMSYNNVMKILFLNNFSLMNSIKEDLILQIMWSITFLFVISKFYTIIKRLKQ